MNDFFSSFYPLEKLQFGSDDTVSPVFTFTFLSVLNANGKVKKYSHSPLVRNNLFRKVWRPGKNQARAELHRPGQTTISVTWPSLEL